MTESNDDKIDEMSRKEVLAELMRLPSASDAQAAIGSIDIGSVSTTSVYVTDEDMGWLAQQTSGDTTLFADTVELETNSGTFVFDTDGDSVTVDFKPEDDDA